MPKDMGMKTRAGYAFLLLLLCCGPASGQGVRPTKVRVNDVTLHYVERGQGEPLILLHGGQGDYRSWGPQPEAFSRSYRVIAYSRRDNYPNDRQLRRVAG